jgi:hypothetical protein
MSGRLLSGLLVAASLVTPLAASAVMSTQASAGSLPKNKTQARQEPILKRSNPCTAYGPGYVQASGSTTCIRIGGKLEIDLGVRNGRTPFRTR